MTIYNVTKGKIGKEDIEFGTKTFTRTLPDGTVITLSQIEAGDIPIRDNGNLINPSSDDVESALTDIQQELDVEEALNLTHRNASAPHAGHVDTTGDETISGVKSFASFPLTPSTPPSADYQMANKKYVDDLFGDQPLAATNFMSYMKTLFGDAANGDKVVAVNETLADSTVGIKVLRYGSLTIDAGVYFEAHANDKVLVILVDTLLTINGTIRMNGRGGAAGAGGIATVGDPGKAGAFGGGGGGVGTNAGGGGGGGGADGLADAGGGTLTVNVGRWDCGGGSTGAGGDGTAGVGGTGANYVGSPLCPMPFAMLRRLFGAGGGGGGATGVGIVGGAGGAGGGVIWIEAKEIVWGGAGLVSCIGANGSVGSGIGARGGGGGGAGGSIQLVYKTKTGVSTLTVTGGTGGAGSGGGSNGGVGAAGITGEFQIE